MSGKLPIDRVREAQDAPRVYELDKRQHTEEQARLRAVARAREENAEPAPKGEESGGT
jgi:hypothetical protein